MISVTLLIVILGCICHPSSTSAIGVNVNFDFTLFGIENITEILGLSTPPVDPSLAEDAKSTTVPF